MNELVERIGRVAAETVERGGWIGSSDDAYKAWIKRGDLKTGNAILSEIAAAGYAVVPVEPTPKMIAEGESAASFGIGKPTSDDAIPMVWKWMLSASRPVSDAG